MSRKDISVHGEEMVGWGIGAGDVDEAQFQNKS